MDADDTLQLLRSRISTGIVLFTGAGFSMAAKDRTGASLPSGGQLAKELWGQTYDEPYDDVSGLPEIFAAARNRQQGKLGEYLRRRFDVDPLTLPEWYESYLRFPWYKVYTLNIDTMWTAMATRFTSSRLVSSTSATTEQFNHKFSESRLCVFNLNGTLADAPNNVVFDQPQFGASLARQKSSLQCIRFRVFATHYGFPGKRTERAWSLDVFGFARSAWTRSRNKGAASPLVARKPNLSDSKA